MTIGPCGYGRYNDDPEHVGCPRAHSAFTPCIARDGAVALADDGRCVGCFFLPGVLLSELRTAVHGSHGAPVTNAARAADKLRAEVRIHTEPQ